MSIEWKNGVLVDLCIIDEFEKKFCIKLPLSYKAIAVKYSGGFPEPSHVKYKASYSLTGMDYTSIGELYRFSKDLGEIFDLNERVQETEPKFIVFSSDPGGWFFAFDYRKATDNPPVYLIRTDMVYPDNLIFVADDFDNLLDRLYDA